MAFEGTSLRPILEDPEQGSAQGSEGSEVYFCASFLAQTKKERGATSGLTHKAAVQISLV